MDPAEILRRNKDVLISLEKGDIVMFSRRSPTPQLVLYAHFAVYIGNEEVVHLTGDPNAPCKVNSNPSHVFSICGTKFDKACVKRENFFVVAGDSMARKRNNIGIPFGKEIVVQRALSKIGEIGYNVMWNNCESFANWCRYGVGWSEQINLIACMAGGAAIAGPSGALVGLAVGAVLPVAISGFKKVISLFK